MGSFSHPFPRNHEMHEAIDPETGKPIIQVITEIWTDGSRTGPDITFIDSDNRVWLLDLYPPNDPRSWELYRFDLSGKDKIWIPFSKVYRDAVAAYDLKGGWPYAGKEVVTENTEIVVEDFHQVRAKYTDE